MKEYLDKEEVLNFIIVYGETDLPLTHLYDYIDILPPEDVIERRTGEWILGINTYYKCSSCQYPFGKKHYNYCPNCGAKMKGELK